MTAALFAGCGSTSTDSSDASGADETEETAETEEVNESGTEDDQAKADEVAALIDKIYVQERNDTTDEDCKKAKEAWEALTDAQKELVSGEYADYDYFGRDTGDASKDDPLNGDDIGENELLVVSFGTSFNDSRAEDIGGIEKALQKAFPDYSVRRAFTAQIIINHVQARDNEKIDNMDQALQRAVDNGVKNLVVQPTHLMHGAEYDELTEAVENFKDKFDSVKIAEPLLGEVGEDATVINNDKKTVAHAITVAAVRAAGYESTEGAEKSDMSVPGLDDAANDGTAFVFMGHGTSHTANVTYDQMQTTMENLGYKNVFIGTVEGKPEDTACEEVIKKVSDAGYKKVILRPLMVVAGDHANNDMAGDDEDSWKSQFKASGKFDSVECQIEGLGRIPEVEQLYINHTAETSGVTPASSATEDTVTTENNDQAASKASTTDAAIAENDDSTSSESALEDGTYTAEFTTDSKMFHVNEAYDDKGTLTVKDGRMTIHISLASEKIVNLFEGTAEDAAKDGAELLQPTTDKVEYSDGTTEEVYGFDVPVPAIDEEFDLALLGTKGKWYDHKVKVSNPSKE